MRYRCQWQSAPLHLPMNEEMMPPSCFSFYLADNSLLCNLSTTLDLHHVTAYAHPPLILLIKSIQLASANMFPQCE